jgi:ribosomal protein S12 methylthiotransferase
MAKVAVVSLGCAKNQVDSEVMLGLLEQAGHTLVEEVSDADAIVVNTCAFVEPAREEAIDALLEMAELKRSGSCRRLICAGCLAQRYADQLAAELPEVDAFVGADSVQDIVAAVSNGTPVRVFRRHADGGSFLLNSRTPRVRAGPAWLAYVKLAEGCDHACSFCAIPAIRGPQQSRPIEDVLAEARRLIEEGVRELNLIAQDTSNYGADLYGEPALAQLLCRLGALGFDGWVRALYLHPARITDELLAAIAEAKAVVPYLDIPLQHAAARVLQTMNRTGSPEGHLALVERVRRALPEAALRTTLLIGFPGETEADFELLCEFVEAARFDRLSSFVYSPEEGTAACDLPGSVPAELARERQAQLMQLQEPISLERNREQLGRELRILLEAPRPEPGCMTGRSYRDAPDVDGEVRVSDCDRAPGELVTARITHAFVHDLAGRQIPDTQDTAP